jgi:hypothetical protein
VRARHARVPRLRPASLPCANCRASLVAQTITFFRPLTIIFGQNGCGKTVRAAAL